MKPYLQATEVIDWRHPAVLGCAHSLAKGLSEPGAIAQACFGWVRDEIHHSCDYRMNPLTCKASEVLQHKTGFCYAKSHLLAALLRANGIPAGFCYQRLSVHDDGEPYSLHGFNAVYLPEVGWYRIDARGNRPGVDAQFTPPQEQLAFKIQFPSERDFPAILAEPLPVVIEALRSHTQWDELLLNLPDISPELAFRYGLTAAHNTERPNPVNSQPDRLILKKFEHNGNGCFGNQIERSAKAD